MLRISGNAKVGKLVVVNMEKKQEEKPQQQVIIDGKATINSMLVVQSSKGKSIENISVQDSATIGDLKLIHTTASTKEMLQVMMQGRDITELGSAMPQPIQSSSSSSALSTDSLPSNTHLLIQSSKSTVEVEQVIEGTASISLKR